MPAVNVSETKVDICAVALHGLQAQGAAQILCIGLGGRQTKAKPSREKNRQIKSQDLKNGEKLRPETLLYAPAEHSYHLRY